jgi:hypothetical protein
MIKTSMQLIRQSNSSTTETPLGQAPPPAVEADATVVNAVSMPNAPPPQVRHFVGTINLGFAVSEIKHSNANVFILLKRFMDFAKQTNQP